MVEIQKCRLVFYVLDNRFDQAFPKAYGSDEAGDMFEIEMELLPDVREIRHTKKRELHLFGYGLDALRVFLCRHENSLYRPHTFESITRPIC